MNTPEDLIAALTEQPGPAACWHCGERGCADLDPEVYLPCTCGCHAWSDRVVEAARWLRSATTPDALVVLEELAAALEAMACQNCDDRQCMSCVCRELHDVCIADCPECTDVLGVSGAFIARHQQRRTALDRYRATVQ